MKILRYSLILLISLFAKAQESDAVIFNTAFQMVETLEEEQKTWLEQLTTQIGARLTGTVQEKQAVAYITKELNKMGIATFKQSVTVPKWVRGVSEFAYMENKFGVTTNLNIKALYGSVPTPLGGVKANLVIVKDLKELQELPADQVGGKVVFFNGVLDNNWDSFQAYETWLDEINQCVTMAAEKEAFGVLVRSATFMRDDLPRTAYVRYEGLDDDAKIPVAALSPNHADMLDVAFSLNKDSKVYFGQSCAISKSITSYNLVGQIKGDTPSKGIIYLTANLDSWDLGTGAKGNAAACAQLMMVAKLLNNSEFKSKHTVQFVFTTGGEQSDLGKMFTKKG